MNASRSGPSRAWAPAWKSVLIETIEPVGVRGGQAGEMDEIEGTCLGEGPDGSAFLGRQLTVLHNQGHRLPAPQHGQTPPGLGHAILLQGQPHRRE